MKIDELEVLILINSPPALSRDGALLVYIDKSSNLIVVSTNLMSIFRKISIQDSSLLNRIDSFIFSSTYNRIYGLSDNYLFIYNLYTDDELKTIKVELGRGKHLVGMIPDTEKVIIAPYSF